MATPEKIEKSKSFIDAADRQKGKQIDMTAGWQQLSTPEMVTNAYDDLTEVWNNMVKNRTSIRWT